MSAFSTRTGPINRLIAVLVVVVIVDAAAVTYAFAMHRNDPPPVPAFTSVPSQSPLRDGVDAYGSRPQAFGFTTTPGRPQVPNEGRVRVIVDGRERFDPGSSLRYALAAMAEYATGRDGQWLDRAQTAVSEVLARRRDGLAEHEIPQDDWYGKPLPRRWASAQTQGLLLSALSRLYSATGASPWRSSADEVFDSLLRVSGATDSDGHEYNPWLSFVDDAGFLWFEQFPQGQTPSRSMTGHLFAVIGIYDYAAISDGVRRATAQKVAGAGAATGLHHVPLLRYENGAAWTSDAKLVRSWDLHQVLVAQLGTLADITGDPAYRSYTGAFRKDTAILGFVATGLVPQGDVDAYSGRWAGDVLPPTAISSTPDQAGGERNYPSAPMKPDVVAASALSALRQYSRVKDRRSLDRAIDMVDRLMDSTQDGLVPHDFIVRNPFGQVMARPWYSAQTQGLLLSALVRLHAATGQQRWADDAGAVFDTLRRLRVYREYSSAEPRDVAMGYIGDDTSPSNLWFEKYWRQSGPISYDYPTMVVDAHIAALIGLYDYWAMTKDPDAARLFDGGASTLLARLPDIRRSGSVSETVLSFQVYQLDHHRVVTQQLAVLAEMTGRKAFTTYSRLFAQDAS